MPESTVLPWRKVKEVEESRGAQLLYQVPFDIHTFHFVTFASSFPHQTRLLLNIPTQRPSKASEIKAIWDLRGQLGVVDQVFQWVAATELVQQTWQVADDGGWVWCVNVARNIANLNQGQVPVGIGPLSRRNLRRTTPVCVMSPGAVKGLFHRNTGGSMHLTENRLYIWEKTPAKSHFEFVTFIVFNSWTLLSTHWSPLTKRRNSAVKRTQHQNIDRKKVGTKYNLCFKQFFKIYISASFASITINYYMTAFNRQWIN